MAYGQNAHSCDPLNGSILVNAVWNYNKDVSLVCFCIFMNNYLTILRVSIAFAIRFLHDPWPNGIDKYCDVF